MNKLLMKHFQNKFGIKDTFFCGFRNAIKKTQKNLCCYKTMFILAITKQVMNRFFTFFNFWFFYFFGKERVDL